MTTKLEKTVEIAKDVLKNLRYMKDRIIPGAYCEGTIYRLPKEGNAQDYISKLAKKCDVCALGACFLSHIRLFDKINLEDMVGKPWPSSTYGFTSSNENQEDTELTDVCVDPDFIYDKLSKVINKKTMMLIETAFEGNDMTGSGQDEPHISDYEIQNAEMVIDEYPDNVDRLRAIMKNVVKNDGVFRPAELLKKKEVAV